MKKTPEITIQRLLWAADFSGKSRRCLPFLKHLADRFNAACHAVFVLPRFSDWVFESAILTADDLYHQKEESLAEAVHKLTRTGKQHNLPLTVAAREGQASEEIIAYAREQHIDLILAGRLGQTQIQRLHIGSTASRLVRYSPTPILFVPNREREVRFESILVPVDFDNLSFRELLYAAYLAKTFQARIHVIHVTEFFNYKIPPLTMERLTARVNDTLNAFAAHHGFAIDRIVYKTGEPAREIIEFNRKNKPDLVIMATHQKRGLQKMLLGSISEKVLMNSDNPVLILPPEHHEGA